MVEWIAAQSWCTGNVGMWGKSYGGVDTWQVAAQHPPHLAVNVVGDPNIAKGSRTFGENFNPAAFALPAVGTLGNGGVGILRGPGINNWDLSMYKSWPWGKSEGRYVQLRTEFYNAFNHTQFSTLNTGAIFNPAGAEVNTQFGAFTAARDPRRIQFALKLVF
jgi:hypothetical protein